MKLLSAKFRWLFVMFLIGLCSPISNCQAQSDGAYVAFSWPTLQRRDGQKQPLVEAVQYLLRARDYNLVVDGVLGNQTAWKLKTFQRDHQLKTTGEVNQATWNLLIVPLKKGDQGDAVRALQTRLKRHGYDIAVNGVFGSQTKKTLGLFQASRGNIFGRGDATTRTWCLLMNGSVAP